MSSKAIADRKEACGYTPATLRTDACQSCIHMTTEIRRPDTYEEKTVLVCGTHDITVTRGSICNDFERKQQ